MLGFQGEVDLDVLILGSAVCISGRDLLECLEWGRFEEEKGFVDAAVAVVVAVGPRGSWKGWGARNRAHWISRRAKFGSAAGAGSYWPVAGRTWGCALIIN